MKTPVVVSVTAGLVLLAGTAFAQDVLKVSPATNKVLVENQYVRVLQSWTPKVGEQAWMDGEEAHSAENVGKTTLQYILVEVKAAPTRTPN